MNAFSSHPCYPIIDIYLCTFGSRMVHFALRSLAHYIRYATINRDPHNEDPALDRGFQVSPLKIRTRIT